MSRTRKSTSFASALAAPLAAIVLVANVISPPESATAQTAPVPSAPNAGCDPNVISADMDDLDGFYVPDGGLQVLRCYPGWAYVTNGEPGDAQSLLRSINGTWVLYAGFPSSISCEEAESDGVPSPELRSFGC